MSVAVAALLALSGALLSAVAADSCQGYTDDNNIYQPPKSCWAFQFCCGKCSNRYCCSDKLNELDDDAQEKCSFTGYMKQSSTAVIASSLFTLAILIILIISCCVCPCCCIYKMCRKPSRPVVTSHTTTVINAPYPQQSVPAQAYQGAPYPGYQPVPVPVQPAYGSQPMSMAPYQAQPYPAPGYPTQNPGPPPPYQETGPAYPPAPLPYNQAGYNPGQMAYPLQPPTAPPVETTQPAYNPAYVEPPKMGY